MKTSTQPKPTLSLAAVPIGNTGDISQRVAQALLSADLILCEDTRKVRDLFNRAELKCTAKLWAIPAANDEKRPWLKLLGEGTLNSKHWVLVSDAGTPVVNDPGRRLIQDCKAHGFLIKALPGPSAPIAAWQWSGGFGLPFHFAGFVPKSRSPKSLSAFFAPVLSNGGTFCYFDSKHQVSNTLEFLKEDGRLSQRRMFIAREISKDHEELIEGTVKDCVRIISRRQEDGMPLGEMTFLLEGAELSKKESSSWIPTLEELIRIRDLPSKAASKELAKHFTLSASEVYAKIQLQKESF